MVLIKLEEKKRKTRRRKARARRRRRGEGAEIWRLGDESRKQRVNSPLKVRILCNFKICFCCGLGNLKHGLSFSSFGLWV